MYSRRQFGSFALAALPMPTAAPKIQSIVNGIPLGVHTVSLDYFQSIRRKFEIAGIDVYGYCASPNTVEGELVREIAHALGANIVTLGGTLQLAKRMAPIAEKHGRIVGFQSHPNVASTNRDQIQRADDFAEVFSLSRRLSG